MIQMMHPKAGPFALVRRQLRQLALELSVATGEAILAEGPECRGLPDFHNHPCRLSSGDRRRQQEG